MLYSPVCGRREGMFCTTSCRRGASLVASKGRSIVNTATGVLSVWHRCGHGAQARPPSPLVLFHYRSSKRCPPLLALVGARFNCFNSRLDRGSIRKADSLVVLAPPCK